jgi:membrane fusion protein (multidrug efflux system)
MALFLSVALCAAAAAYQVYRVMQPEVVYTDNAYVGATLAQVTPRMDGTIAQVLVHDTEYVRRGQLLVTLDRQDAELDYQTALAAYDEATRQAQEGIAKTKAAEARVRVRAAAVEQAQQQLNRRRKASVAISDEEVSNARTAVTAANYALAIAQNEAAATRAMVRELDSNAVPAVRAAEIGLARARLRLRRTELRAPIDGVVAQLKAQPGQQIGPGQSLMSIVPIHQLYVEANFKESEIDRIRVGQRVRLTSDFYGPDKLFHGTVDGIGGGTGAAFAILPAQNASGNWIKVVQRIPVRIVLDTQDLRQKPLRVGLSMTATVELGNPVSQAAARPALRMAARSAY